MSVKIISQGDVNKLDRVDSIDGVTLSNLPPLSMQNKGKDNGSGKTAFQWKVGNKSQKKTKKLIIF